jgi:type I restriction enzyme S subunit
MKKVKLADLFEQYRIEHIVQDDKDYGQITISKNGYIKFRTIKNGKSIGRKRQFIIDLKKYPNTLLFTRQGVAEGAIAFAPKEVDGCIVTENMPMFSLKDGIDKKFVELLLKSEQYISEVKKLIPTGSAQKSIHERDLMQITLNIPDEKEQKQLAQVIDSRLNRLEILNTEIQTQQQLLKKLRQSILQEAIEGKLTSEWREQNSDVERASVLLEKIKQEKERLIKEKKIKKQKPLPPISEDEVPFEIPESWVWCRFGDIASIQSNLVNPLEYQNLIQIGPDSIEKNTGKLIKIRTVKESEIFSSNHLFYKNQLIYSKVRPKLNKVILAEFDGLCSADMYPIHSFIESKFLQHVMLSEFFYWEVDRFDNRVKMPKLNQIQLRLTRIPLPPITEQKEIVKKIESLFALCDKLEIEIESSKKSSEQLIQAVLKEAFEK